LVERTSLDRRYEFLSFAFKLDFESLAKRIGD
jgi:hypothetical protein